MSWKWSEAKVAQLCLTFCGPTVHRILQARILEWVAIPFSRASSQHKDWTWVSCIAGRFFTIWATREALKLSVDYLTSSDKEFSVLWSWRVWVWMALIIRWLVYFKILLIPHVSVKVACCCCVLKHMSL